MTSDKKIQANRQNALESTGPRTPEGKAAVRLNALKHGLLAQKTLLLPGEDPDALQGLGQRVRDELRPVGEIEQLLVEQIVDAFWRLGRASRIETGILAWEVYEEMRERAVSEGNKYGVTIAEAMARAAAPVAVSEADEMKRDKAFSRARQIQAEQVEDTAMLGRAFARDANRANALPKLSRYESGIQTKLYRAMRELERRQASRETDRRTSTITVDMDVSGQQEEGA